MSQLFFLPGDESFIMALGRGSAVGWRDEVAVGFEEVNQEWMQIPLLTLHMQV